MTSAPTPPTNGAAEKPVVMANLDKYIAALQEMGRSPLIISDTLYKKLKEYGWTTDEIKKMAANQGFAGYAISERFTA